MAYLQSLGEADLPGLVRARPAVLGEGIEAVVRFLQLCRVQRREVHRMLRSYPMEYAMKLRLGPATLSEILGDGEDEEPKDEGAADQL